MNKELAQTRLYRKHFDNTFKYFFTHLIYKMDSTSAKKIRKDVYTEFGKREELEFENKRFRTDPETSEEAVQDTAVTETASFLGSRIMSQQFRCTVLTDLNLHVHVIYHVA
jgi:hypothetical protein